MEHLYPNKLLSNAQHGLAQKICSNDITTKCLSQRKPSDLLLHDFAKSFDIVTQKLLLHKLERNGVVGNLLGWIKAFLTSRIQKVVLGDHSSVWTYLTSGLPQCSFLGPTLFLVFINDLSDALELICKMYADDTKLFNENS